VSDPELLRALTDDRRITAGYDRYLDAAFQQHANTVAIE
jgi:hypothetical protein